MLRWRRIGLGGSDWICPGVQPGKGVFTRGRHSSFAPRAHVSVFEFATLRLWSRTCVLGDRGGCLIVLIGWSPQLGVRSRVYAPGFHLFSMYACLYVSLGCVHWFWSVYSWFCIRIWDIWCFSTITDVSVDYLTDFYNKSCQVVSSAGILPVVLLQQPLGLSELLDIFIEQHLFPQQPSVLLQFWFFFRLIQTLLILTSWDDRSHFPCFCYIVKQLCFALQCYPFQYRQWGSFLSVT